MDIETQSPRKSRRQQPKEEPKLYVKLSTLARALDCSRGRIRTAIQAGDIEVVHVLGMARIPIKEFERLVRGSSG